MYAQDNNSLPVWSIFVTSLLTHISINSQPFLVGIVSEGAQQDPMTAKSRSGSIFQYAGCPIWASKLQILTALLTTEA